MKFSDYQEQATATAVYPGQGEFLGLTYAALGLNGEAGECAEKVKKTWRDDVRTVCEYCGGTERREICPESDRGIFACSMRKTGIFVTDERRAQILKEVGDTLWYAAQICTELDADMDDVAMENINKLRDRRERDVLHGAGDDR
jgi:NTP pyrophosphatase (non-canonical NTP hydrolase)